MPALLAARSVFPSCSKVGGRSTSSWNDSRALWLSPLIKRLATEDPSPLVRLFLASAMTRLPVEQRWGVVAKLAAHAEDVGDQNLPLMYWYALEPMVAADPRRGLGLAMGSKIPTLREFAARRVAEMRATTKDTKVTKN